MVFKRRIVKALCACLIILLLIPLFCISASAEVAEPPSMEEATAALLYHMESNTLVCSKAENVNLGAGSTVKVMAGLLFCEAFSDHVNDEVLITSQLIEAVPGVHGRILYIEEGDVLTVKQLLYAAICGSYNDAFYILGTYLAGSTENFLQRMNQKAQEIGATQTSFTDLTGIQSGSRTSAYDLLKIAQYAYENDLYMEICSVVSYSLSSLKISKTIYNRNALVCSIETPKYYHKYCFGMSAGSTSSDGNCVVAVAEHEGETYLCIVLGGIEDEETNVEYGYKITNRLIDWVYATYSYIEVISPETEICTVPVTVSDMTFEVNVRTDESLFAYLPAGVEIGKEITYSIRLSNTSLEAPVEPGTFVGYIAVIYEERVLGMLNLYTVEGAERSSIMSTLQTIENLFQNRAFCAGLIFFILSISAWVIIEYTVASRRKHKWDKYFSEKMDVPTDLMKSKPQNDLPKHRNR
ncbi:MAG: D-alanyl-D-alanine carboxypeptidase [Clostridia bacterium]|nr:D-alanyl-D-alanine carboxypeptidase [Clostridia bacterium]